MVRYSVVALFVVLFASSACERQPTGPGIAQPQLRAGLAAAAADQGPPSPPPGGFASDTYQTEGPYTGREYAKPGLKCDAANDGRTCDGYLASDVDGTLLDARLQIPQGPGPFPLVVLLHGYAGSKTGSGDIADALLADGYVVLRYSARGFGNSWGRVNLADLSVELGDLRSMIAAVVDHGGYHVDPGAVAVTGASYGGGQSWLALVQPTFTTPRGATVRIRAVVPIVPWSDLLYSLAPNGRPRNSLEVLGGPKLSYVNGLFVSGERSPDTKSPLT